ncbi:pancreatic alpha-amylase-like [Centruroides sculpturatus]|uniref:pancreatic alpha-amylase-like n=1 Tax=Centruroides sculpturatus TaxID=218467 RepID=UPI000C6E447F|nr:pancreatic alpha-amylase-like [Centruroides sculpturatus]XP_023225709.1 pancreatic alpha-amylase-like [Centruroides sculpturatus]XP_023225710.1 pancreatic alpha-amylase-like [Centruroides sculpturatus]XP_023225711.1 pancreatic alpha-amylase-like [Centruroides sculpturatus]XP_023225713.1 pancreatic alpha-amylase-like [Centruroides sculpturatus]
MVQMVTILLFLFLQAVLCSYYEPNTVPGKSVFVHLFEWRWKDVADECEQFLGPFGFGGVQISPPNENGIVWEPFWNKEIKRPWFERYQPVSYKLGTRSGTESEFREMVRRCNNAGVRIYVDAVINHMTGDIGKGQGTAGSHFDPGALQYYGVPYGPSDFNNDKCHSQSGNIENYQDKHQVRDCRLSGLADLNLGKQYVRDKITEYLNYLIDIGVAGFRFDAAKHMWPSDIKALRDRLKNLNTEFFPPNTRPFVFQEVIDLGGGEAVKADEYLHIGRVTEFRYGKHLGDVIRKNYDQRLKYLKNFGEEWGMVPGGNAITFIDNHDNQRGHGAGGFGTILTFFEARMYKMASAFMLAWPYGLPRVMSSYQWPRHIEHGKDKNDWIGPPHDDNYNIKPVIRNSDMTCGNGWVCEHRWRQIYNMVKFRNVVGFEPVDYWWDNNYHQIAFGRKGKGFLVINNDNHPVDQNFLTGLPAGTYCDVISGNLENNSCTGKKVNVGNDGRAQIFVDNNWEDPMLAIHIEAKLK